MNTSTGQLNTINASSKDLRSLRNATLNLIEDISKIRATRHALDAEIKAAGITLERLIPETELQYLDRLVLCLANIEADVAKAELLASTRKDLSEINSDMASSTAAANQPAHPLRTERKQSRMGKLLLKLATLTN